MPRRLLSVSFSVALCLASVATTTALATTPAETRLDLRQLAAQLPGDWDNEPQRFVSAGMGAKPDSLPARRHLVVTRLGDDATGRARFRFDTYAADEHSAVESERFATLEMDTSGTALRMRFEPLATRVAECDLLWSRRIDQFDASVAPVASGQRCESPKVGGIEASAWSLGAQQLWLEDNRRSAPSSALLQFFRTRQFECFAALARRDGKPEAHNPLLVHDRGGTISFNTDEPNPRHITLQLRRSMWPSKSGNNFVELLQLYLYEDGPREFPIGNAWATPESGRVGFGQSDDAYTKQKASARCKLPQLKD